METLELIQKLYNPELGIRRQATLIVGMVQETAALAALEQRLREESDFNIKKVVMWAGKRVQHAQKNNFSTIDAIFEQFGIDRELASGIDPEEIELLRHQAYSNSGESHAGMFGDIRLGSTMTADQIKTGRLGARSADKKAMLRLPPMQPTNTDIGLKIKQLMNGDNPKRQKNAAIALREINNPAALPYLALVFHRNENPDIQDIIERSGKLLYWNINYAAMEHNGRLKLEIAKRLRDAGYIAPPPKPEQPKHQVLGKEHGVTDILNQAQKRKRLKKR